MLGNINSIAESNAHDLNFIIITIILLLCLDDVSMGTCNMGLM